METPETHAVELTWQVTQEDYLRFSWWHSLRHQKAVLSVCGVVLLLSLALAASAGLRDLGALVGLIVVGAAFVWASVRRRVARAFASNAALRAPARVVISPEGMSGDASWGSSNHAWSVYWRAAESRDAFYLYLADNMAQIVPKRCFASTAEMDRFRQIVREGLGPKARL